MRQYCAPEKSGRGSNLVMGSENQVSSPESLRGTVPLQSVMQRTLRKSGSQMLLRCWMRAPSWPHSLVTWVSSMALASVTRLVGELKPNMLDWKKKWETRTQRWCFSGRGNSWTLAAGNV